MRVEGVQELPPDSVEAWLLRARTVVVAREVLVFEVDGQRYGLPIFAAFLYYLSSAALLLAVCQSRAMGRRVAADGVLIEQERS